MEYYIADARNFLKSLESARAGKTQAYPSQDVNPQESSPTYYIGATRRELRNIYLDRIEKEQEFSENVQNVASIATTLGATYVLGENVKAKEMLQQNPDLKYTDKYMEDTAWNRLKRGFTKAENRFVNTETPTEVPEIDMTKVGKIPSTDAVTTDAVTKDISNMSAKPDKYSFFKDKIIEEKPVNNIAPVGQESTSSGVLGSTVARAGAGISAGVNAYDLISNYDDLEVDERFSKGAKAIGGTMVATGVGAPIGAALMGASTLYELLS